MYASVVESFTIGNGRSRRLVTAVLAMLGVCPAPVCLPLLLPCVCCMVPRLSMRWTLSVCRQAAKATHRAYKCLFKNMSYCNRPIFRACVLSVKVCFFEGVYRRYT